MDHIGIDVHKKESQICILAEEGELLRPGPRRPSGRAPSQFSAALRGITPSSSALDAEAPARQGEDSGLKSMAARTVRMAWPGTARSEPAAPCSPRRSRCYRRTCRTPSYRVNETDLRSQRLRDHDRHHQVCQEEVERSCVGPRQTDRFIQIPRPCARKSSAMKDSTWISSAATRMVSAASDDRMPPMLLLGASARLLELGPHPPCAGGVPACAVCTALEQRPLRHRERRGELDARGNTAGSAFLYLRRCRLQARPATPARPAPSRSNEPGSGTLASLMNVYTTGTAAPATKPGWPAIGV